MPSSTALQLTVLRDGLSLSQVLSVLARLVGHGAQYLPISGSSTEETDIYNHTWPVLLLTEQGFASRVHPLSHLPIFPPLCISLFCTSVKILKPVAMKAGILTISEDSPYLPA